MGVGLYELGCNRSSGSDNWIIYCSNSNLDIATAIYRVKNLPVVADKDELRILRALITETEGRGLEIYKSSSFYRSALDSLNERGLIRQKGDKYYLTETGEKVVRKHLAIALKRKWFG